MKEFAIQQEDRFWQIISIVTLSFDSKAISVIWITYCYLHPIATIIPNMDILYQKPEEEFVLLYVRQSLSLCGIDL